MGVNKGRKSQERLLTDFHEHYGSSPVDVSEIWYDLCLNEDGLLLDEYCLSEKEKTMKGFKRYLSAHFWLWARPKNASMMESRFDICRDYCRGKSLWIWIERIALLMRKKIYWDEALDSENTEIFCISADGVDFKMWEKQHKKFPYDSKAMSHKFRKCGAKYIIAISVFRRQAVLIAGPFKGGVADLDMFTKSGLMARLKENGKVAIVDRGFRTKFADELKHFSYPDYMDSSELHNFKSRVRLRQETFNGRLKFFQALDTTFKNGFLKHGIALRAVATIVQYQMDNGSPIYDA